MTQIKTNSNQDFEFICVHLRHPRTIRLSRPLQPVTALQWSGRLHFGPICGILVVHDRRISLESPPISKRKPPSQRPERKLDETAKAIARAREEAIALKAEESKKSGRKESSAPVPTHAGRVGSQFKSVNGPAPTVSTKQPKNPGS